jgi:GTP cyclohydrolase I
MKRMIEEDTGLVFPSPTDTDHLTDLAKDWLQTLGEDPTREGLLKTPERMAKAWAFLTKGYWQDLEQVTNGAVFQAEGSEMVVVKGIEFYSMCEHHLLPFFGKVHIGYIPNGKILGLSKFGRITDMFARRLQVQERLAAQISDAIYHILTPQGVAVVIEGVHLCMMMRGVEKQHSATTTSAMRGVFREQHRTRDEFMSLIATKTLL